LLLEPSRTNLIDHSEYFNASGWFKSGAGVGSSAVVTDNYAISPEGVQNATRLQLDLNGGSTSSDQSLIYDTIAVDAGDNTRSIYVKSNDGNNYDIYFGGTLASYEIKEVTSEWTRIDATRNFASSGTGYFSIGLRGSTGCSDTADILIYGAQLEAGSYPTSYIPTYGASATRSNDYYSNTSLSNIGSTDRCTFYCEIDLPQGREGSQYFFRLDSSTSSFAWKGNYVPSPIISIISTGNITGSSTITVSAGVHKLIVRWENGIGSIFVDGVKKSEQATSSATEVFDEFRSDGAGYRHLQKSALVFPEALSDAECITLTT